jgi:hypothetical protein
VFLAYIDPGAGSMVIQALLAGALAVPFLIRSQLRAAVGRLRRKPRPVAAADSYSPNGSGIAVSEKTSSVREK